MRTCTILFRLGSSRKFADPTLLPSNPDGMASIYSLSCWQCKYEAGSQLYHPGGACAQQVGRFLVTLLSLPGEYLVLGYPEFSVDAQ